MSVEEKLNKLQSMMVFPRIGLTSRGDWRATIVYHVNLFETNSISLFDSDLNVALDEVIKKYEKLIKEDEQ